MIIGIDASRYAHEKATGVEWYSKHIIENLVPLISKENNEVVFYAKNKIHFPEEVKTEVITTKRLWTLWGLSRRLLKKKPDVLFVPSHTLPLVLPKRSVITIHDVAFRSLKYAYSFFQYHYLNWSTKFAVKHATKIIVPSEATKHDLIHFFKCPKDKIEVVYHGFTPPENIDYEEVLKTSDMFKYFGINKESKYILFVGRLETKKNLVNLIRAFKTFSELHPEFRLILAGKRGVGFDQIFKVTKELNMFEKVIMPGYITEDEKATLYKYCSIFAFPSLYEGFGLPILEAFYFKKPVLTSKTSSLPEVGKDAVTYTDPYDADSISEGLEKIVNEVEYREQKTEKGTEVLKEFSWKTAAKKTLEILTAENGQQ